MILIVVRWPIKPEHADTWMSIVADFTAGTRSEPGNLWFDWSRSVEDPNEYVLVEAFRGPEAATEHVTSQHFKTAQAELPQYLARTPKIINVQDVPGEEWHELGEMRVE